VSVADAGIKMHFIATKLFIQASDKRLGFASTNMPTAITPHPPVANAHQIAAKNGISFFYGNAHTPSLNGTPAAIVYLRVIT